jgi:uncharacterized membrane protein
MKGIEERKEHIRWIARTGIFTALAVSLGYLLFFIPNVELISATIFASGWLFGMSVGASVGGLSFAIFSLFNPLGASLPPLFIAQVFGGVLLGISGHLFKIVLAPLSLFFKVVLLGIVGGFLTLIYDIITNVGGFIAFTTEKTFFAYLISGIVFSVLHIVSNVLIFTVLLFPLLKRVELEEGRRGL